MRKLRFKYSKYLCFVNYNLSTIIPPVLGPDLKVYGTGVKYTVIDEKYTVYDEKYTVHT